MGCLAHLLLGRLSEFLILNGHLIDNDHLNMMDYLIAEASRRGIYMLFSPIVTYDSQFPEMNDNSNTGYAKLLPKTH